ncbi:hypothetical protein NMY22_g7644 [Coprinellus aureogranulatus]|nr:hypothetical protein NMY22_g7644 [Coprinellus aureogranulatus]
MRTLLSLLLVPLLIVATALAGDEVRYGVDLKTRVWNPNAKGPNIEKLQHDAFVDYVNLWVTQRDVLTAYDKYVPGCAQPYILSAAKSPLTGFDNREYRQHSPFA